MSVEQDLKIANLFACMVEDMQENMTVEMANEIFEHLLNKESWTIQFGEKGVIAFEIELVLGKENEKPLFHMDKNGEVNKLTIWIDYLTACELYKAKNKADIFIRYFNELSSALVWHMLILANETEENLQDGGLIKGEKDVTNKKAFFNWPSIRNAFNLIISLIIQDFHKEIGKNPFDEKEKAREVIKWIIHGGLEDDPLSKGIRLYLDEVTDENFKELEQYYNHVIEFEKDQKAKK